MNAEKAMQLNLVKVAPVGDGRTIVFQPIFSHPFYGWEIRSVF